MNATERECPFCSSAIAPATPRASTGRAFTRAAILFAGASALGACSSEPVVMYGPAPIDAATDAKDANNLPDVVAMYGPVPVDASTDVNDDATDATPPDDAGTG